MGLVEGRCFAWLPFFSVSGRTASRAQRLSRQQTAKPGTVFHADGYDFEHDLGRTLLAHQGVQAEATKPGANLQGGLGSSLRSDGRCPQSPAEAHLFQVQVERLLARDNRSFQPTANGNP
jgi:hypothetical protein